MSGFIYAIGAANGLVKVGFTTNLKARLSHLRANNAEELDPIGHIKAEKEQERRLHYILYPEHVRGEWFRRGPVVSKFLCILDPWMDRPRKPRSKYWDRSETGTKPSAFAAEIGVAPSTITRIIRGERSPGLNLVMIIQRATGNKVCAEDWYEESGIAREGAA